jgi:hypothetical protein
MAACTNCLGWALICLYKSYLIAAFKLFSISLCGCAPNIRLPSEKISVGVLVTPTFRASSPMRSSGTSQLPDVLGNLLLKFQSFQAFARLVAHQMSLDLAAASG